MRSFTIVFLLFPFFLFSQKAPEAKFGKVAVSELEQRTYPVEPDAPAVVLYDIGSTQIVGNKKGWFSLEFKRKTRIHILNKKGYDVSTIRIPVFRSGEMEEEILDLKAATYNLENGKVVQTKLEKSSVFSEKLNKEIVIKKFALPSVKEGSIIEYEYKLVSDFLFNLQPWHFQSTIPHLWSEYKVGLPQFLKYILISQVNQSYILSEQKDLMGNFSVNVSRDASLAKIEETVNISCGLSEFRWAMSNLPAFKEEVYTSSANNYINKLEFQLAAYLDPLTPENIMTTWPEVADRLLKKEDFGQGLNASNDWLNPVVAPLIQNRASATDKIRSIFEYVRDNFRATGYNQIYTDQSLKELYKSKTGGRTEINLLLVAMLRAAGINSDPVILSTVENGLVYEKYPIIGKFNYVICAATGGEEIILLDASNPFLGFGKLPLNVYNGQGRFINKAANDIRLTPDQLNDKGNTFVKYTTDGQGNWNATAQRVSGYYESLEIREKIHEKGEGAILTELAEDVQPGTRLHSLKLDSVQALDKPVRLGYVADFKSENNDVIYLGPILSSRFRQNPFKSDSRAHPVELPYKLNDQYTANIPIPAGYMVEELPKAGIIRMDNGNDLIYEYKISKTGENIVVRTSLELNRTKFQPREYKLLRDFFGQVVAKQNEQIVFKKK